MEEDNIDILELNFTITKVYFKQTNILSIKCHLDYKISYGSCIIIICYELGPNKHWSEL